MYQYHSKFKTLVVLGKVGLRDNMNHVLESEFIFES